MSIAPLSRDLKKRRCPGAHGKPCGRRADHWDEFPLTRTKIPCCGAAACCSATGRRSTKSNPGCRLCGERITSKDRVEDGCHQSCVKQAEEDRCATKKNPGRGGSTRGCIACGATYEAPGRYPGYCSQACASRNCPSCGGSKAVRLGRKHGESGVCGDAFHGEGTFWAGRRGRSNPPRFREGDIIETTGDDLYAGIGKGSIGVLVAISGGSGHSVHPDPAKMMVYAIWHGGHQGSVLTKLAKKIGFISVARRSGSTAAQERADQLRRLKLHFEDWVKSR